MLARIIDRLRQQGGDTYVSPEQRATEALQALGWLAQIALSERAIYERHMAAPALEEALYRQDTAATAIDGGNAGTVAGDFDS